MENISKLGPESQMACLLCERKFKKYQMKDHISQEHLNYKPHKCLADGCDYKALHMEQIYTHRESTGHPISTYADKNFYTSHLCTLILSDCEKAQNWKLSGKDEAILQQLSASFYHQSTLGTPMTRALIPSVNISITSETEQRPPTAETRRENDSPAALSMSNSESPHELVHQHDGIEIAHPTAVQSVKRELRANRESATQDEEDEETDLLARQVAAPSAEEIITDDLIRKMLEKKPMSVMELVKNLQAMGQWNKEDKDKIIFKLAETLRRINPYQIKDVQQNGDEVTLFSLTQATADGPSTSTGITHLQGSPNWPNVPVPDATEFIELQASGDDVPTSSGNQQTLVSTITPRSTKSQLPISQPTSTVMNATVNKVPATNNIQTKIQQLMRNHQMRQAPQIPLLQQTQVGPQPQQTQTQFLAPRQQLPAPSGQGQLKTSPRKNGGNGNISHQATKRNQTGEPVGLNVGRNGMANTGGPHVVVRALANAANAEHLEAMRDEDWRARVKQDPDAPPPGGPPTKRKKTLLQCYECGDMVPSPGLVNHVNSKHLHFPLYRCRMCGRPFESPNPSPVSKHVHTCPNRFNHNFQHWNQVVDYRNKDQYLNAINEASRRRFFKFDDGPPVGPN